MQAKGYNLGDICCQKPKYSSSNVPVQPLIRASDLSHQYVRNQGGFFTDWRKHPRIHYARDLIRKKIAAIFSSSMRYEQLLQASDIATILEYQLFIGASSEEEYMNPQTLIQRLQTQVHQKLYGPKFCQQMDNSRTTTSVVVPSSGSLHALSSQSLAEPAFQPYCRIAVNHTNVYGFPKGGVSHPFTVHETVFSPDDSSSVTTCTDMDGFSDFGVTGTVCNLETSSKRTNTHIQQQNVDDLEIDLIKYRGYLGTNQQNDSTAFLLKLGKSPESEALNLPIPQHVPRDISEVSSLFSNPSMSSSCQSSSLEDLQQYQPQKWEYHQNLNHFKLPYKDPVNASMAQSGSCFVVQDGPPGQMLGQKTSKRPQLPSRLMNGDQQFTSENSAFLYSSNGASSVNSSNPSEVSLERKILLAYFHYKNSDNLPGDNRMSLIKYLHSTVCDNGICSCEQYVMLLLHFDKCQSDDCHICLPLKLLCITDNLDPYLKFANSMNVDSTVRYLDGSSGNSEGLLQPTKRQKMEPGFGDFSTNNEISDLWVHKMVQPYLLQGLPQFQQQPESPLSLYSEVTESTVECTNPILDSTSISEKNNNVIDDTFEQTFETNFSKGLKAGHISEETHPKSPDVISSNLKENVSRLNLSMHTLCNDPSADVEEEIEVRTGFDQSQKESTRKVIDVDLDKGRKSSNLTINGVSLSEFFTYYQIREHIMSLRHNFGQSAPEQEKEIGVYSCQLCAMDKLLFAPVPIYCLSCGTRIKRNANYYCGRAEEVDTQHSFCTSCYRDYRGGFITFNGISISKAMLYRKKNNELIEESWVQCDRCENWQHQICALFNNKRDLEGSAEYVCPRCCLREIENGMRVPLPETATFGAKDLPRTVLSDHIEQRLFEHLKQERANLAKVEGKNLDEVLGAENLAVRVVLSVDKQLKVKKQFLDIFCEENYPAEFPYRSKVILLFQKIEGVDVCLFGMYVQEFGSECGYPNQRCVYISYLDSVKYFRPQRETVIGEALRTFVYHEILIGYLDFCKKGGFATCYIWACPPLKGEDYLLYCHPETQKTPKSDKLRHWYHSMLRKAAKENIVVGFTNIYDHFFVATGKCDSKVTAAHLPYFDGDYWTGAAMDLIRNIEQQSGGEYQRKVKKLVTKRTLKAMGHTNPSEGTTKDILVMQKLGQTILPVKEDFIVVHLHYACMRCREVILSGKRWFCSKCKNFQQCERCHITDTHTSVSGEKHTLCQVLVDDIPLDTKENDIIIDNGLFENRHNFLSFCQKNHFQFDTLRRAKHSSVMILYHLKNPTLLTVETICSICCKDTVFQQSWQCEICPQFTACSVCYKEKGASCHVHKLNQCSSTVLCRKGNQEFKRKSALTQQLLEVLLHASQCHSSKSQPCSHPNCLQIKKLFCHASRCAIRAAGGCQHCKKAWLGITIHSRNCRDSECRIPRCMDLKKHAEWIALQSESRRRAAVVESVRGKATEVDEHS